jgi:hypothetical protein
MRRMRERKAAEQKADAAPRARPAAAPDLRDADDLLGPAIAEMLDALDLKPDDAAVRKLAQRYAHVIDGAGRHCSGCDSGDCQRESYSWAMRWIAPLLLDTLEQLGATPAARARLKGGKPGDAPVSQLAKLRASRRA